MKRQTWKVIKRLGECIKELSLFVEDVPTFANDLGITEGTLPGVRSLSSDRNSQTLTGHIKCDLNPFGQIFRGDYSLANEVATELWSHYTARGATVRIQYDK